MRPHDLLPGLYAALARTGWRKSAALDAAFRRAYFLYKRLFEDPFHELVQARPELFHAGHVLDVGANIGYTASVFARAVDPGYAVYAFEPEAANFAALERLARRWPGVIRPIHAAVGESSGEVDLQLSETHPGDHRVLTERLQTSVGTGKHARVQRVRQVSIDDFLRATRPAPSPVRFVKVDVQGSEISVCRGMRELITSTRDPLCVAIEYEPTMTRAMGFEPTEALDLFLAHGFELRVLERGGRVVPCATSELEARLGARGYLDLLFLR